MDRWMFVLVLASALIRLAGCAPNSHDDSLATTIRYEMVGSGTSRVDRIGYREGRTLVEFSPPVFPWSHEFDTQEDSLFLAVWARDADPLPDTARVQIMVDGDVVWAESYTTNSSDGFFAIATYMWHRQ